MKNRQAVGQVGHDLKQGIIRAADVNADYAVRTDPFETLQQLRTLTAS